MRKAVPPLHGKVPRGIFQRFDNPRHRESSFGDMPDGHASKTLTGGQNECMFPHIEQLPWRSSPIQSTVVRVRERRVGTPICVQPRGSSTFGSEHARNKQDRASKKELAAGRHHPRLENDGLASTPVLRPLGRLGGYGRGTVTADRGARSFRTGHLCLAEALRGRALNHFRSSNSRLLLGQR